MVPYTQVLTTLFRKRKKNYEVRSCKIVEQYVKQTYIQTFSIFWWSIFEETCFQMSKSKQLEKLRLPTSKKFSYYF